MSNIRWDLVEHVREQIEAGTYATPGKLRIVCDRLLEKLLVTDQAENELGTSAETMQAESDR